MPRTSSCVPLVSASVVGYFEPGPVWGATLRLRTICGGVAVGAMVADGAVVADGRSVGTIAGTVVADGAVVGVIGGMVVADGAVVVTIPEVCDGRGIISSTTSSTTSSTSTTATMRRQRCTPLLDAG